MARCTQKPDVSIVVPYRDRPEHLKVWLKHVRDRLPASVEIIVVKQTDKFRFNRGCLLNIGFRYCLSDRIIFHDVDLIPFDSEYYCYDSLNKVKHLSKYDPI